MYEHESGLPFAFDSTSARPGQQSLVFYGERPFIQARELNEIQSTWRAVHNRFGRLVAKDGDRTERADAIVDIVTGTVTLSAGRIYVSGDIFPVEEKVLAGIPMVGRTEIGVRLTKTWLTHDDDPSLLGLVPGSLAEGERGAGREIASIAWAHVDDGGEGTFYAVYTLQDGTIIDQRPPSLLEPAMAAIAAYDRANGNYVVSGCRVTWLGADAGDQVYSIEQGEANINGLKRIRHAALRYREADDWDELAVPGETHTYPGGASHTFTVSHAPIGVINSILLTKEKTVNITRGAIANGADGLPDTSVIEIIAVSQGATTFDAVADFNLIANNVDWAPAGDEPAGGSDYTVTYRYRALVEADAFDNGSITVSGGADGGDIIVAYTQKLPRIDRLCLQEDGSALYLMGVSSRQNALPPAVPLNALRLCTITHDWMSPPRIENDGVRSRTWDERDRIFNFVFDLGRLMQTERLQRSVDAREPVAKKGIFADPMRDDTYRDHGIAQSGSVFDGMLMLSITPTFYTAELAAPVTLDFVEEVIVSQPLKTLCEKINPYANFIPLPGQMSLSPAVDFWTVSRTAWTSPVTRQFNQGVRFDGGPLQSVTNVNEVVDQRIEQLEFLRPIDVGFEISGFGAGEILDELTFDGVDVKPPGVLTADGDGKISGTFTIPETATAGTKEVRAAGQGETEATALFTGQGTVAIDVMRRVTTIENWTAGQINVGGTGSSGSRSRNWADPQAQLFAVSEARQIVGVDFHVCHVGDDSKHLLVDQVTTDNGYPTADVVAEALFSMVGAVPGWKQARYAVPMTTAAERHHAFVIKTDDNDHSISVAKLGGFDADEQKRVTTHPYVVGPRFSSVNAATWTAHQDEALAFKLVAAKYTELTKTVDLGTIDLVVCSDLQVRAAVELPSAGCSVVFEVERSNGTIYRLLPFQVLALNEYITETVELRAVLKGTEKLSPILYAPVEVVAGEIAEELTYVTRAMSLGEAVRISAYYKAWLPGGATVAMEYQIDGGAWVALPLEGTEPLAFPLWSERHHEEDALTGTNVRLKITGTGGPAARLIIGDFGASII